MCPERLETFTSIASKRQDAMFYVDENNGEIQARGGENFLGRVITWVREKLHPGSTSRPGTAAVTSAYNRFVRAVVDDVRYSTEGTWLLDKLAPDVVRYRETRGEPMVPAEPKPLTTRRVRQIMEELDERVKHGKNSRLVADYMSGHDNNSLRDLIEERIDERQPLSEAGFKLSEQDYNEVAEKIYASIMDVFEEQQQDVDRARGEELRNGLVDELLDRHEAEIRGAHTATAAQQNTKAAEEEFPPVMQPDATSEEPQQGVKQRRFGFPFKSFRKSKRGHANIKPPNSGIGEVAASPTPADSDELFKRVGLASAETPASAAPHTETVATEQDVVAIAGSVDSTPSRPEAATQHTPATPEPELYAPQPVGENPSDITTSVTTSEPGNQQEFQERAIDVPPAADATEPTGQQAQATERLSDRFGSSRLRRSIRNSLRRSGKRKAEGGRSYAVGQDRLLGSLKEIDLPSDALRDNLKARIKDGTIQSPSHLTKEVNLGMFDWALVNGRMKKWHEQFYSEQRIPKKTIRELGAPPKAMVEAVRKDISDTEDLLDWVAFKAKCRGAIYRQLNMPGPATKD